MDNRYKNTQKIINNSQLYKSFLQSRDMKKLTQYATFDFNNLRSINTSNIESVAHTVQPFEKLYMISQQYYGSPEYGWLICFTNSISNELQINTGDTLLIYLPLQEVLGLL